MTKDFLPYSLAAAAELMGIFASRLPGLAAKYGCAAGNLPQNQPNFTAGLEEKPLTDFVNEVVNGKPGKAPPNDSLRILASCSLAPPETGLKKRLRKIAGSIETQKSVYIQADGELLFINAPDRAGLSPENAAPELKLRTAPNFALEIEFRRYGREALRVETRQKGGDWKQAAILTSSPATFNASPLVPGNSEQIEVRGVFLEKNRIFGSYSPVYPAIIQP